MLIYSLRSSQQPANSCHMYIRVLDCLAMMDGQDTMVLMESRGHPDHKAPLDPPDHKAPQDPLDHKAPQDPPDHKAPQDPPVH